jgi:hypothetical protein
MEEQWREIRGVVKATVTSLVQKTHRIRRFPPQSCEVIQLARITGSDPVHARSNRALAAKLNVVAESSGRMPDCLSGGTGSTPVATATGVRTRWEGRWSPKPVLAGSNPVTPARVFESEHGIAAGASGLQPDDASSTLAARSRRSSYRSSTPDRQSGSMGAIPVLRSRVGAV